MLIVRRSIQAIGGSGINMLVDVVICDLITLRKRGKMIGLLFAIISMTASFEPLIGSALAGNGQRRWVFFLNVQIGAVALGILFLFLRMSHRGGLSWQQRIGQIDYVGNTILIASTVLILYIITYAGTRYSSSNAQMLALLVVGLVLLVALGINERSPFCAHPVMSPALFENRTSSTSFFIAFNHSLLTFLMLCFSFPLFGAITGGLIAKTGEYRLIHLISMSLITTAFGYSSLLKQSSPPGLWVVLQLIVAAGLGAFIPSQLPAIQAGLTKNEAASSTTT